MAAAAARAGLDFVVFTDHGDGTRRPEPPVYRAGVLCLDGVELSTFNGHYIAIGLERTPYPLRGEARDVIDDVRRLGGFGVVAHPGSSKPELQWTDWTSRIEALEWLNADSEWRDEHPLRLARALFDYLFRPSETLAATLDRPQPVLGRWDRLAADRSVVALAAADAHARIGFGRSDPYEDVILARLPSYERVFRTFSNYVLAPPRTSDAAVDGQRLLDALRGGRSYTVIEALAAPARLDFRATEGDRTVGPGDSLPGLGPVTLDVNISGPPSATIVIRRNGTVIRRGRGRHLNLKVERLGAQFRVEVMLPNAPGSPPTPWMLTNPIYVGLKPPAADAPIAPAAMLHSIYSNGDAAGWHIENDPNSKGGVETTATATVANNELLFRYALGGGEVAPSVALVAPIDGKGLSTFDRLTLQLRADRPVRFWVQLRAPGQPARRWARAIYADTTQSTVVVPFSEMRAIEGTAAHTPPDSVDSLMFVVDAVNTQRGSSGAIWFDEVRLEQTAGR